MARKATKTTKKRTAKKSKRTPRKVKAQALPTSIVVGASKVLSDYDHGIAMVLARSLEVQSHASSSLGRFLEQRAGIAVS